MAVATANATGKKPGAGTDWSMIVLDLRSAKVTLATIARHTGRSVSTVWAWSQGAHPKHRDGEVLLALWSKHVAKEED